jgi:multiple sugar transport system permease protein
MTGVSMTAAPQRKKKVPTKTRVIRAVLVVILAILSLAWIIPVIATILTSLRSFDGILTSGFMSLEGGLSFDNYVRAWESGGGTYLWNSMVITIPALVVLLLLASMAGFVLSRFDIPFARGILLFMLAGNLLPQQILLIPYNRMAENLGIFDTHFAVIMAHIGFQMGFFTFITYNFIRQLPNELFEAARVDGCDMFTMWWRVLLPVLRPPLAALGTLGFAWIFNDLLFALALIRTTGQMPVTVGLLSLQGQFVTDYTVLSASAIITAIPTIFLFIVLQRQFVSGLTLGSVK